jgi:hypothetical protein
LLLKLIIPQDKETAEDKEAREKNAASTARSAAKGKFGNSCLPHQTSKAPRCNVVVRFGTVVEPCDGCVDSGDECRLPEQILSRSGIQMASISP